ncbi:MAG: hypothetical protein NXY59_06695 [Aigarchaeota archaeon]|nr:hypothetical protein [Candidatus Pelearchaeum maunauluense]
MFGKYSPTLAVGFVKRGDVLISIAVQVFLGFSLAHGYDFRVGYVAGRNIAMGSSPYFGGELSGELAVGYGADVQGIGETPLWALYMGLAYIASSGSPLLFNMITKIPIIAANVSLAYLLFTRGNQGWRFFLFNPFLILVSSTWGKADNLATLLIVLGLMRLYSIKTSATSVSLSILIKPLIVAVIPAFLGYLRALSKRAWLYLAYAIAISSAIFLTPFMLLGWPLATLIIGFPNWFRSVGGISPFNIVSISLGGYTLPAELAWLSYTAPIAMLALSILAIIRPPKSFEEACKLALLSAAFFFTARPWVSEQNLVLVLTLLILVYGCMPSRLLWAVPLLFMIANNSLPQQLYLVWPQVIEWLASLDTYIKPYRLAAQVGLTMAWLAVLWRYVVCAYRGGMGQD